MVWAPQTGICCTDRQQMLPRAMTVLSRRAGSLEAVLVRRCGELQRGSASRVLGKRERGCGWYSVVVEQQHWRSSGSCTWIHSPVFQRGMAIGRQDSLPQTSSSGPEACVSLRDMMSCNAAGLSACPIGLPRQVTAPTDTAAAATATPPRCWQCHFPPQAQHMPGKNALITSTSTTKKKRAHRPANRGNNGAHTGNKS